MLTCMTYILQEANECNAILSQNYNRFSIFGVFITLGILFYTAWNLHYIRKYNENQFKTQREILKQNRLIELSHEWNSKDFIIARNEAALLMKEFKDREDTAYPTLSGNRRLSDWIYVSMIAHFFERLSYIQMSRQILRKNAILEFEEAIEYWHDFLHGAYTYDRDDEKRMCNALTALRDEYRKSESDIP